MVPVRIHVQWGTSSDDRLRLVTGYYTGLLPTLARDLPFSGIYYMSYRKLKDTFADDTRRPAH